MNNKEYEKFEKIGEGKCANIYKSGNNVYKILKENTDSKKFYSKEMLQQLAEIENDLCVFPNEILEDANENLIGYSMDFVNGKKLKDIISTLPFEQLELAIKKAEKNIKEISDQNILFEDMHDDNIMWDDESKSIKIIDTDFFKKINENSNLKNINYQSFAGTLQGIIDAKINEYGKNENEQFNPFYDVTSLKYKDGKKLSINEYILNLKNVVENDFGKNFNNLSEIEKALKEKQYNFEEKQHMEQIANNLTLKEKIIRALVKGKYLRKIPFVNKIINKNIKMLPSDVKEVVCDKREQFRKELRNFEPNIEPKAKKNDLNMERQNEVNNHDEIELK